MSLEASIQSLEKTLKEQIDLQKQILEGQARIFEQAQQIGAGKGAKASAKAAPAKAAAAEKKAEPAPAAEEKKVDPYAGDNGVAKMRTEAAAYLNEQNTDGLDDRKLKVSKLIEHFGGVLKAPEGEPRGLPTIPEDKRSEFAGVIYGLSKGEDFPEIFGEAKSAEDDLLG